MFDESYLEEQREIVSSHLEERFKINLVDLPDFGKFTDSSLRGILSLKIWKKYLEENKAVPNGPDQYVDETISNLNQVLVMGIIGFKTPSCIMLRRSLENSISFLYYKDHSVEFSKKEYEPTKKKFLKINELKEYIESYPFYIMYKEYDYEKIKKLIKKLMDSWLMQYKELSNFVHGTNSEYLDLKNYLNDITPENIILVTLMKYIQSLSSIVNTLNILFFFDIYKKFDEVEKSLIRLSISDDLGFKRELIEIFGEI